MSSKRREAAEAAGTPPPSPAELPQAVRELLERRAAEPGALLPILHELQDLLGCVPPKLVPHIAVALNLSRAEVHGVVSYYHHFRSEPAAPHVLQICRAEACRTMGGEALLAHAREHLGCDAQGRSRTGELTVEPTYCLGLCASSPALMLDDTPHARITPQALNALLAPLRGAVQ